MRNIWNFFSLFLYTSIFTLLIFFWMSLLVKGIHISSEEDFIEWAKDIRPPKLVQGEEYYSFSWVTQTELNSAVSEVIYDSFREKYQNEQKEKVIFRYIPLGLEERIQNSYTPIAEVFVYERDILKHIDEMKVFLYNNRTDRRGRMKGKNIHMFGVPQMSDEEFLSVFLHEFAHYFDIHSFSKNSFWDESQKFYDISWDWVNVLSPWLDQTDFVSGYSMTNQYEDFAESYLYYILHNRAFLQKAETSEALKRKYNFFRKYVFEKNQFYKESFARDENIEAYYWDITKISVDVKKFLQYLQDEI